MKVKCSLKKLLPIVAAFLIYGSAWGQGTTGFGGGTGSSANPFIISTPAHLAYLRDQVNLPSPAGPNYVGLHFKVTADLDLSGYPNWVPIGNLTVTVSGSPKVAAISGNYFAGIFDGGGYTISNMTIAVANAHAGLFGAVGSLTTTKAVIRNVAIDHTCSITSSFVPATNASTGIGSLVGYLHNNTLVEQCYSLAQIAITVPTTNIDRVVSAGGLIGAGYLTEKNNTVKSVVISKCFFGGSVFCTS
ncbi:MAG: hypothetical protein FWF09_06550, partial [Bacteroidales bacterium]|nr:hypothetical protein [Bacteroidales bacterium]